MNAHTGRPTSATISMVIASWVAPRPSSFSALAVRTNARIGRSRKLDAREDSQDPASTPGMPPIAIAAVTPNTRPPNSACPTAAAPTSGMDCTMSVPTRRRIDSCG